ncbi:MAG: hypothetical protein KatS3mg109_0149 [Pirellulaceae bacterium]|nr:MAG: hypothetical protein KatS3mg109_0149 [Pirellulaceae bacterium]
MVNKPTSLISSEPVFAESTMSLADRKKLLHKASLDLREWIRAVEQVRKEALGNLLVKYYEEAVLWRELLDNKEKYGVDTNKDLFEYFGMNAREIYRRVAVARAYTHQQILKMSRETNCRNEVIGVTVLAILATCDEADRADLYKRWKKEGLSRRELIESIKDLQEERTIDEPAPALSEAQEAAAEEPTAAASETEVDDDTVSAEDADIGETPDIGKVYGEAPDTSASGRTPAAKDEESVADAVESLLGKVDTLLSQVVDIFSDLKQYDLRLVTGDMVEAIAAKVKARLAQIEHLSKPCLDALTATVLETAADTSDDNDEGDLWGELDGEPVAASDDLNDDDFFGDLA